jgi:hypothetical protein
MRKNTKRDDSNGLPTKPDNLVDPGRDMGKTKRPWILVQGPVILPRLTARDPRRPNGPIVDHKRYLTIHSPTICLNVVRLPVPDLMALGMS